MSQEQTQHGAEKDEDGVPLYMKAVNFVRSQIVHVIHGRPYRTEERVKEIFETHCLHCPMYIKKMYKGSGGCNKCGCPVNLEHGPKTRNKLALATEKCPMKPPKFDVDI